ncbi:hypothetical protein N0V93_008420 [Gnomoniopsis smithogilvyi]|uniref:Uncharacterized protein n=1 Tax=Gnomoniopsis smithogilvyi TaxID=1191159 RepID=A0A9W8YLY5_9PEZI|nr:hypothetical protein N0V93_008420 [Gnomoniopsis smithogilvyi]
MPRPAQSHHAQVPPLNDRNLPRPPPLSENDVHIRRLSRAVRAMHQCANKVQTQSQELRIIVQQARLLNASYFDDVEMMAQTQCWRLTMAMQTFRTVKDTGLGKSPSGRRRLAELRSTIGTRKKEMAQFREFIENNLQVSPKDQARADETLAPELQGSHQKQRISDHLDSMADVARQINHVAAEIAKERLTKFEVASEEAEEEDGYCPESSEKDLRPTEEELQKMEAARKAAEK